MTKKLFATLASLALLADTTSLCANAASYEVSSLLAHMDVTQRYNFEAAIAQLGYSSPEDFIHSALSTRSTTVDSSRIKDLNGDNAADTVDVICLMQFLNGSWQYTNDYRDLDVTGDCLLNSEDADAYLRYYVSFIGQTGGAPYSASYGSRTMNDQYEYRTYIKCTYPNGTLSEYTLSLGADADNAANLESNEIFNTEFTTLDMNESTDSSPQYEWEQTGDTRMVRIGQVITGTKTYQSAGFIVGDHVIATAAHCVYNYRTDTFNPFRAVWAYTYDESDGELVATEHALTIASVHIPKSYYTATTNTQYGRYDYALIVVEEDLSSYGCFELGVLTTDAIYSEFNNDGNAFPLTVLQYSNENDPNNNTIIDSSPVYYDGWLLSLNEYRLHVGPSTVGGISGSAIYATSNSDTITGIINSTSTGGLAITRPLLHFYLNNNKL